MLVMVEPPEVVEEMQMYIKPRMVEQTGQFFSVQAEQMVLLME
jgi:hypothetical protein